MLTTHLVSLLIYSLISYFYSIYLILPTILSHLCNKWPGSVLYFTVNEHTPKQADLYLPLSDSFFFSEREWMSEVEHHFTFHWNYIQDE